MVAIEYNKVKISVPESWDDITLGFYETFYTVKPETARERVALVAHICKTDANLLLGWPAEIFNRIVGYIGFLFEDNPAPPSPVVEVEGVKYVVPIEDELSLGAWVDADDAQKKEENVLSNILAIVCRPVGEEYNYKNNEARAAMFAALPVSKVLGVLAFFLHYKTVLDQRTAAYTKLAALVGQLPQNIKPLLSRGGGIKLSLIWPTLKYYVLIILLRYQLRKFLPSYSTVKTKTRQKTPSVS
ncbi:hypothetical protein [Bacteroides stercorirosoris]|uniref:Uncharacterized protein n=1 Tax=Bacteroides stercorirosoris TaxID=871324 RepID=A0A1M6L483_9BACE|nr:hypothetical protein [Bacteroides stercorirosoris]SHJ66031.1 hypothetical protein SAMN05444350_14412 [Bacteroides stercorirosoris]